MTILDYRRPSAKVETLKTSYRAKAPKPEQLEVVKGLKRRQIANSGTSYRTQKATAQNGHNTSVHAYTMPKAYTHGTKKSILNCKGTQRTPAEDQERPTEPESVQTEPNRHQCHQDTQKRQYIPH